ncbi:MAG: NYN domain-containing protein [Thiothrix sp.]|nr:MAG: NYN domain-containing protein [Thiothrix sp.]
MVHSACAYAIYRGDQKPQPIQDILRGHAFQVKLKPYIQRRDGSSKGDWDVGITLDVVEAAAHTDIIVLASGDGDFDMLLQRVQQRYPVETEVYGVPILTANTLINSASRYIPIKEDLLL